VKELREFASKNNIKIPSKSKKIDIINLLQEVVSHPDFVDRTQEIEEIEEIEEELVAGFDEDEDLALLRKEKTELKFWQKPPFSSLLDTELAKESEIAFYDLAKLVDEFFDQMLHEELINYKISGIALKTSATLHHYKISSIIREEEQIQKREELEKFRQRHGRAIPKALAQPIQPKMQIATKDELFDAMRSAIIEVMQKKEKLRRRRMRNEELKQQRIQMKSKAQLPKELLKHISGRDQTIEELHDSWYNRIKATIELNNKESSLFDLANIVNTEEKSDIGRKFSFVRMFLALMFLSTGNKLVLSQDEDFQDIEVNIK
jgi:chromatin segregation and condensation protein Rec8/ScpA/Scc1 (kleisin family)